VPTVTLGLKEVGGKRLAWRTETWYQGRPRWVRLPKKPKPNSYTEPRL